MSSYHSVPSGVGRWGDSHSTALSQAQREAVAQQAERLRCEQERDETAYMTARTAHASAIAYLRDRAAKLHQGFKLLALRVPILADQRRPDCCPDGHATPECDTLDPCRVTGFLLEELESRRLLR